MIWDFGNPRNLGVCSVDLCLFWCPCGVSSLLFRCCSWCILVWCLLVFFNGREASLFLVPALHTPRLWSRNGDQPIPLVIFASASCVIWCCYHGASLLVPNPLLIFVLPALNRFAGLIVLPCSIYEVLVLTGVRLVPVLVFCFVPVLAALFCCVGLVLGLCVTWWFMCACKLMVPWYQPSDTTDTSFVYGSVVIPAFDLTGTLL